MVGWQWGGSVDSMVGQGERVDGRVALEGRKTTLLSMPGPHPVPSCSGCHHCLPRLLRDVQGARGSGYLDCR